jgi:ABC-type lipoprotein release transport system permease subunit
MKISSLRRLVLLNLARDWKGAAFSALGVAIGIGSLVFFVSLGLGVDRVVTQKIFPIEATLVDVVPPSVSIGVLGGAKLDQSTVDRLAKLSDVAQVYRKMNVRIPAASRYDGPFFGSNLRIAIEILAVGVDAGLVRKDVLLGDFSDPVGGGPIPAVASSRLLEIYNKSFAPPRNLPQLSPSLVVGFTLPVLFNRTFVGGSASGPSMEGQVQVVGVSERALVAGINIPLETAMRLNRLGGADAQTFSGVTLVASDPAAVPRLIQAVKGMGLQIDDQERRLAQNAGAAVLITPYAMALLSMLICLLAAVNIAQALFASVSARAKEIGIMQAVGASRRDIRNLILAEAAVVGLIGGGLGVLGALALAAGVDRLSASRLPNFPFKPDTFFSHDWRIFAGGLALGIIAALAGSFLPSRQAAGMNPATTIAE